MKAFTVILLLVLFVGATANERDMPNRGDNIRHGGDVNPYEMDDEEMERIMQIVIVVYLIACAVVIAIAFVLLFKCYKKNQKSSLVKDQMRMKRMQFSTQMGVNYMESNNGQLNQVVHI
jgi:hypothetical protein